MLQEAPPIWTQPRDRTMAEHDHLDGPPLRMPSLEASAATDGPLWTPWTIDEVPA